jgi:hypothetical protein
VEKVLTGTTKLMVRFWVDWVMEGVAVTLVSCMLVRIMLLGCDYAT